MSDFSIVATCKFCKSRFAPDDGGCCELCDECREVIYRTEPFFQYKIDGKQVFICRSCADEYERTIAGELTEEDND